MVSAFLRNDFFENGLHSATGGEAFRQGSILVQQSASAENS
jgi:hypothetical protein